MLSPLKVAVIGPEASGKTIMAKTLASYFNCPVVEDFCSYYLDRKEEGNITKKDLENIAKGKLDAENNAPPNVKCIISDNGLISLKLWSEYKFNSYSDQIKQLENQLRHDLYLLLEPTDMKSNNIRLRREEASLVNYFFNAYKKELDEKGLTYMILKGDYYNRKKTAVEAINALLKNKIS